MTEFANSLFEQVGNIAKAHNADIYANRIEELEQINRELIEALEAIVDDIEELDLRYRVDSEKALIKKAKIISR